MSVVIETTLGDITVDLFLLERPRACLNFLKLCKIKYYNYNLFHTISRGFIAQTGDPTGSRTGGQSIYGILDGPDKKYFSGEKEPRIKHTKMGLISFVGDEESMIGSQFFFTLGEDLTYLDPKHCVFGEVVEGFEILEVINETICDTDDRPYQDVRITHTVVLDDPFPDPKRLIVPSRSPSPTPERLQGGRIAPDEEIDEMQDKSAAEVAEFQADREAKARATILEMVGDIPDAEMAPPENVLFVCKLNPITTDDDLEIIFNRFGKIKSCEVIRDKKTGDSLQYAFIEFEDQKSCEDAYFKMDNILIDDRRIHVDFSQSVSKIKWHGKGRGVTYINLNKTDDFNVDTKISKRDKDDVTKNRDSSRNYDKNGKNYSGNRNKNDRYKQTGRNERKRSRSVSPDRRNVKQQRRSLSIDMKYDKSRYDRSNRDRNYSRDYHKETKKYDSTYDSRYKYEEKTKYKQSKSSSRDKRYDKVNKNEETDSSNDGDYRSKERKSDKVKKGKKRQTKDDSTDSEYEKKDKKKKRKQSISESDSDEEQKIKKKKYSDKGSEKKYKTKDKKKVKSKKVEKKYSSDSSDSSESDYKSREKSKKNSDKKHRQDSSDSETERKSKKKSVSKKRRDSSSDSDNYKKSKYKKR